MKKDLWFLKTIGVTYISTLPTTWLQWLYGYKLYSKLTKTPGPSNRGVSCPKLTLDPNQRFSAINRLFVWWIIQLSPIPKKISPVDLSNHIWCLNYRASKKKKSSQETPTTTYIPTFQESTPISAHLGIPQDMDGILLPIQPKSSDLFPPVMGPKGPEVQSWWPNRSPWLLVAGFREENGCFVVLKGVNLVSRQGTPAVQVILNQTPLEGPMILRVGRLQGFYDESCVFFDRYIYRNSTSMFNFVHKPGCVVSPSYIL